MGAVTLTQGLLTCGQYFHFQSTQMRAVVWLECLDDSGPFDWASALLVRKAWCNYSIVAVHGATWDMKFTGGIHMRDFFMGVVIA